MNILLSLGGLLVVAALASPCCLPDTLSFDWNLDVNVTSQYGGGPQMYYTTGMSGSGAYDFNQQYFYVQFALKDTQVVTSTLFLDLSKKPGYVVSSMKSGNRSHCMKEEFNGKVGKVWQCVLDNTNIFTPISGNQNYQLDITNLTSGVVTMQQDNSCHPLGAEAEMDTSNPYATELAQVRLQVTNRKEKFDESIFKAPCQAEARSWRPPGAPKPEVPTPDQLIQSIMSSKQPRK